MGKTLLTIAAAMVCAEVMVFAQPVNDAPVQEELVVLGTKMDTPKERTTTNTVVITAKDIETYQWKTMADVMHGLPGVSLVRNGAEGGVTTAFVRGAKSENTLVLLNGMRINDPAGVGRGYDFANLSVAGVKRIELMLGPQTALYGTDASAGVINIVTDAGAEGRSQHLDLEIADEDTQRLAASVGGANGSFRWSLAGGYAHSDYLSARNPVGTGEGETDAFENTNLHLRLGYRLGDGSDLNLNISQLNGASDIDAFDGDDPNYTNDLAQTVLSLQWRHSLWQDRLETRVHAGYSDVSRRSQNFVDAAHPESALDARFDGTATSLEWRNRLQLHDQVTLLAGAVLDREEADTLSISQSSFGESTSASAGEADDLGVFLHASYISDYGLSLYGGLRYDDHERFGGETTYRGGADYVIEALGLRLRASYGTGFKAPSLFQLFSDFGNLDLQAESSESLEFGFVQDLFDGKGQVGLTYFENDYDQLIEFFFDPETFNSFYFNLDRAEASGYEFFADWNVEKWGLRVAYDVQDANDVSNPDQVKPLIRRFDDKASLRLHWRLTERLRLHGEFIRYGESRDTDFNQFPAQDVVLDAYGLFHAGLAYQWGDRWQLRLRGENLTNEDYQQVLGFNTPGRRLYVGTRIGF